MATRQSYQNVDASPIARVMLPDSLNHTKIAPIVADVAKPRGSLRKHAPQRSDEHHPMHELENAATHAVLHLYTHHNAHNWMPYPHQNRPTNGVSNTRHVRQTQPLGSNVQYPVLPVAKTFAPMLQPTQPHLGFQCAEIHAANPSPALPSRLVPPNKSPPPQCVHAVPPIALPQALALSDPTPVPF